MSKKPTKPIAKRKYVRVKDRRVGLKPSERTLSKEEKAGNQWTLTPKQIQFAQNYFEPDSPTFSNAYQSAIKAGYTEWTARQITSNALNLQWIKDASRQLAKMEPKHIVKKLEALTNANKDSDKIRALELLARVNGLFIDRSIQHVDVQFTNAVPRPNVPSEARTDDISDLSTNSEVIDL